MEADVAQIMQMMSADPSLAAAPALGAEGMPVDPMALPPSGVPMPGAGMGTPGAFPSTDPASLAQAVQDVLAQMAGADHQMLEMQQQQAAMQAQPIIDQMMMQAAAPQPDPAAMADPMLAFGEGALPPMPPEEMVA